MKKLDHLTTINIREIRLLKITIHPKNKDNRSNCLMEQYTLENGN